MISYLRSWFFSPSRHDGGYAFAPSGMIFWAFRDEFEQAKKGQCMQKVEVQHSCEPFIYSKKTTTTTLMWCVRLWPSHMHGWPACPCVQSWIRVHQSLQTILSIALLLLRPCQLFSSPYSARHTCTAWPCQGRVWSHSKTFGRDNEYWPFGALLLVLPRCMNIVAIFIVYVIQKHAKSNYHLCV